jgi:DNA-directed RNA polymerase subunit M/transcription elongation factor TFIIS
MPESQRIANNDYQQRAKEFAVGDKVFPYAQVGSGASPTAYSGRVVTVWPAIGMVDVEFPTGNARFPVEELQKTLSDEAEPPKAEADNVPGGSGTEPVSAGPKRTELKTAALSMVASRVARAYVKKALYWGAVDRNYRATKAEVEANHFQCPKCKHEEPLQKAIYKREDGQSVRLLACRDCLFLIKRDQVLNHPEHV